MDSRQLSNLSGGRRERSGFARPNKINQKTLRPICSGKLRSLLFLIDLRFRSQTRGEQTRCSLLSSIIRDSERIVFFVGQLSVSWRRDNLEKKKNWCADSAQFANFMHTWRIMIENRTRDRGVALFPG